MTQFTKILDQEPGIQFDGVHSADNENTSYPITGLIVGYFRRGRFDKPMTITEKNIRGVLGHDSRNPYYRMVRDVLDSGRDSIQVLRLPERIAIPEPVEPVPPSQGHEVELFDYAVVRYMWTEQGGQDLDTRTLIIDPPRNIAVGWNKQGSDEKFLNWVADNTATGVESVLIDVSQLKLAYPNKKTFSFLFKAFWYSSVYNGKFTLQVETYKGGRMEIYNNFDYINVGGVSVQSLKLDCFVGATNNYEGRTVAQLSLDVEHRTGRLFNTTDQEPEQKTISISSSSGISLFSGDISLLKLLNVSSNVLFNGANQADPLILRNSSDHILFE